MIIKLSSNIEQKLLALVETGEFATAQLAVEQLLTKAIQRIGNKSFGRFLYEEPSFTTKELQDEKWRAIPGFSQYEVSDLGRIRSLRYGNKRIKLSAQTGGYRQAPIVGDDGKQKFPVVHRLVAAAFLPAAMDKTQVNHKNGNKADNRLTNLEWLSAEGNSRHAVSSGLRHWRGAHHRAKVTEQEVRLIRQSTAINAPALSEKYGLTVVQIRNIREGKSWKHVS